jgi:2-polyprenyl-6-hydroxyphenyl methylase/3-demethylubiquinone-9 3-methyltransferase
MSTVQEVRFSFGKNWSSFLTLLDESRIQEATDSLKKALNRSDLTGLRFLDIGSGSGLFSLAARSMGAEVYSFDYDTQSVDCTKKLKERYFKNDTKWVVEQGSVLDKAYLESLGQFDILYSWGVLHHTGNMMQAFENVSGMIKPSGYLFISIYNDQGGPSKRWTWIKKTYNQSGSFIRWLLTMYTLFRQWTITFVKDFLTTGNPLKTWRNYARNNRGMSAYYDLIDWVGGYPFEVAKPETVFQFFKVRNFSLLYLKTCAGGLGCNEYIFQKDKN